LLVISLETAGSLEEVVCARTPGSKQRVYLYRIQSLITPPPCLLIVLELMQTLFRRLNITFLQIESQKNPALSPGRCPNSNLSILTIGTTMTHQTCVEARRHTQVQRMGRRKALSELLPNTTMQARDSEEWERRKRAPRTNFGCSICKIPFCRKDECWLPHIERLNSKE
jgi:hypothetical protein